jgi:hypothetical protein
MGNGRRFNKSLEFDNITIEAYTMDKIDLKSVYFIVRGYFDMEMNQILYFKNNIGRTIKKIMSEDVFQKDKMIINSELPVNIVDGFNIATFEYTIFLKKKNIIDHKEMEPHVRGIMIGVYDEHFKDTDMIVSKTKL